MKFRVSGLGFFLAAFTISFLVLVYRCPSPLFFPDFYGEDGRDYLLLLCRSITGQQRGAFSQFFFVAFLRHDGFYLFGNVLLAQLGIILNNILFRGDLADLARSMSLVGFGAFAALFAAAASMLRRRFGDFTAWFACLWFCALPMPRYPELILGRISNCGLLAFFAALLVVLQRTLYTKTRAGAVLCDLLFVLCVYSNPATLLLAPFLYARQFLELYRKRRLAMSPIELVSALVTIACCAIYVVICLGGNILTPAGYMKGSFLWNSGVELLLARSILFPLIDPVYQWMSDWKILLLTFLLGFALFASIWRANAEGRWWYFLSTFSLVIFSVVALVFRPGFSVFVSHYDRSYLSHPEFFYLQNYLAIFLFAAVLHGLMPKARAWRRGLYALCGVLVLAAVVSRQAPRAGIWNLCLGTFPQELELRYWDRTYTAHYYAPDPAGKYVQVRTAPFDNVAQHRWWPALLPRDEVERSRVAAGEFQRATSSR